MVHISSCYCDERVGRSRRVCPACAGQFHVQMEGENGQSAFTSAFQVPLGQWCQISVMIQGATVSGRWSSRQVRLPRRLEIKAVVLILSGDCFHVVRGWGAEDLSFYGAHVSKQNPV